MRQSPGNLEQLNYTSGLANINEAGQIYELQKRNLKQNLPENIRKNEGFLSLDNSMEEIIDLIEEKLILVARDKEKIIGYWIILTLDKAKRIEFERKFINHISNIEYLGKSIQEYKYCIMGQTCIDSNYRGKNISNILKEAFLVNSGQRFDFGICEISEENTRSAYVHTKKMGFNEIGKYKRNGVNWTICVLPTNENINLLNTLQQEK